jgi:hypothetical protein
MTRKSLQNIQRALAPREYAVNMAPLQAGGEKKTVKVIARSPELASAEANRLNPEYIASSTRVLRVMWMFR